MTPDTDKPARRKVDEIPQPAVIEHLIAEGADVVVRFLSFRADKAPSVVVPEGRQIVVFCLGGLVRVEAGQDQVLDTMFGCSVDKPGPVRLCPLVKTTDDPTRSGATVVVVEMPAPPDLNCPRRDHDCDPDCAEWSKGERTCDPPRGPAGARD